MWKDLKVVAKIEKHEMAVWAVKFVGEDRILTGGSSALDPTDTQPARTKRFISTRSAQAAALCCKSTRAILRWSGGLACVRMEKGSGAAEMTGEAFPRCC